MKFFISILSFLLLSSCSFSPSQNQTIQKPNSPPILEITNDFEGAWWMQGKVLGFRAFENRFAEYDDYPTETTEPQVEADKVKTTKSIVLNQKELDELKTALRKVLAKNDFEMTQKLSCIDAFIFTDIKIDFDKSQKMVKIDGHCSDLSDADSVYDYYSTFPPEVIELFKIIKKIKDKTSKNKYYT